MTKFTLFVLATVAAAGASASRTPKDIQLSGETGGVPLSIAPNHAAPTAWID